MLNASVSFCEEAAAEATAHKLALDEVHKPVEAARVQVQLSTPTLSPLPSLPSEQGDYDDFGCDHGYEMDDLGMDTDGPCSAGEEAGRDAALCLGIDVQERGAKRGRSASVAPPPPSQPLILQRVIEQWDAMRQSFGDEAWQAAIALSSSTLEECG